MNHFAEMLASLFEERVKFLIAGGYALAAYGIPRATGDIDIWVEPTPDNAERVYRSLLRFGAPLKAHRVEIADFTREDSIYQFGLPPQRIDIVTSITGVTFAEAWENRINLSIMGILVDVICQKDFIDNKKAVGRPKYLSDAAMVEEIIKSNL
ncbi:MAG: hypothetical protein ACKO5E_03230 [bacterium]